MEWFLKIVFILCVSLLAGLLGACFEYPYGAVGCFVFFFFLGVKWGEIA